MVAAIILQQKLHKASSTPEYPDFKGFPWCFCINLARVLDPTSDSGSLLINIGQCVSKYMDDANNIKYYAQELKPANKKSSPK